MARIDVGEVSLEISLAGEGRPLLDALLEEGPKAPTISGDASATAPGAPEPASAGSIGPPDPAPGRRTLSSLASKSSIERATLQARTPR